MLLWLMLLFRYFHFHSYIAYIINKNVQITQLVLLSIYRKKIFKKIKMTNVALSLPLRNTRGRRLNTSLQ